jgi:chemotaxis protein histidine kinase CheA
MRTASIHSASEGSVDKLADKLNSLKINNVSDIEVLIEMLANLKLSEQRLASTSTPTRRLKSAAAREAAAREAAEIEAARAEAERAEAARAEAARAEAEREAEIEAARAEAEREAAARKAAKEAATILRLKKEAAARKTLWRPKILRSEAEREAAEREAAEREAAAREAAAREAAAREAAAREAAAREAAAREAARERAESARAATARAESARAEASQIKRHSQLEKKMNIKRLTKALKNVLAPILKKNDTLENRVHFSVIMRKYLSNLHLKPCMQERSSKLVIVDKHEKVIFKFTRRIGSDSKFGVAYSNTGTALSNLLKFSCKIMSSEAENNNAEIVFLEKMNDLVINGICPNMPLLYKTLSCERPCGKPPNVLKECPKIAQRKNYFIVMNELATNDVTNFLKKKQHLNATYQSIIMQMIMAIYAFHNIEYYNKKYIHNDCHLGNFLVHKINPGGYWKYEILVNNRKRTIYIPNTGYQIVLWDPGLIAKYDGYNYKDDYFRCMNLLLVCETTYAGTHPLQKELKIALGEMLNTLDNNEISESKMIDLIFSSITQKKIKFPNIYIDTQPVDSHIVNTTPYTCK